MMDGSRASQSMFPTRTVLPSLRLWVRSMFRSTRGVASISLDLGSGAPGKKLPSRWRRLAGHVYVVLCQPRGLHIGVLFLAKRHITHVCAIVARRLCRDCHVVDVLDPRAGREAHLEGRRDYTARSQTAGPGWPRKAPSARTARTS